MTETGVVRKRSLAETELADWRDQWLQRFPVSLLYVDHENTPGVVAGLVERLKALGCLVTAKFNFNVTIIISDRIYNASKTYAFWDPFGHLSRHPHMKIWSAAKCTRFLNHFRGVRFNPHASPPPPAFHYFDPAKCLTMVYDLQQRQRPVGVKEYSPPNHPRLVNSPVTIFEGGYTMVPKTTSASRRRALHRASSIAAYRAENATLTRLACLHRPPVSLHRPPASLHRQPASLHRQLPTPQVSPTKPDQARFSTPPAVEYCEACGCFCERYETHAQSPQHHQAIASRENTHTYRKIDSLIAVLNNRALVSISYWSPTP